MVSNLHANNDPSLFVVGRLQHVSCGVKGKPSGSNPIPHQFGAEWRSTAETSAGRGSPAHGFLGGGNSPAFAGTTLGAVCTGIRSETTCFFLFVCVFFGGVQFRHRPNGKVGTYSFADPRPDKNTQNKQTIPQRREAAA